MSLYNELKRRNVIRVGIAYLAGAWLLIEVTDTLFPVYGFSDAAIRLVVTLLAIGFPITLVLSWVYELTPEGLKLDKYVDHTNPTPRESTKKLDRIIIVLLTLALGYLAFDKFVLDPRQDVKIAESAAQAGAEQALEQARLDTWDEKSIAVLPLDNLMGDSEQDYFVSGMHEALITELSKISALKVISRTSAMRYRNTDKSVPEIARELGVAMVIEGSVLRAENTVRITAQLIEAATDNHLWGDNFDRELSDILALHSDVARAIARKISVTLKPGETGRTASVVDPSAYEDYLKGQYQWHKRTPKGWEAAIDHFQQSIEKDPSYAPAYAMLSFAYSMLAYYTPTRPPNFHNQALAASERAVALDNSLAEAHASLALVKTSFYWDWSGADKASQEALRLNPNSTMVLLSRAIFLSWIGRHEEAIGLSKRAVKLDPVAPHVNTWFGMFYFMARRYDEAIEQLNKVLALEPDYLDAHLWLCFSYAKKGLYEKAATESQELHWAAGSWLEGWILVLAGKSAEAHEVLEQLPAEFHATPSGRYFEAIALGALGEKDHAFASLEQAYQGRTVLMSVLKVDPRIDSLRDDPRFQELLRRMTFPP